jgi:hypothetical protein
LTETVNTLAHLARFIIADLTDPSSLPQELYAIVPHCLVAVQPVLMQDDTRVEFAMFGDLQQRYHWVLPIVYYKNTAKLLASLYKRVIIPAERKAKELEKRKNKTSSSAQ